jgi:hypothetical protein
MTYCRPFARIDLFIVRFYDMNWFRTEAIICVPNLYKAIGANGPQNVIKVELTETQVI